ASVFAEGAPFIRRLASASHVEIGNSFDAEGCVQVITDSARIFLPLAELIDTQKEKSRLNKERQAAEKEINMLESKLQNSGFVEKAPAAVVEGEREKLARAAKRLANIIESLEELE
ncbi:MAG: valine--tRNA ligase, partial [Oscillospiraceae bacterium]|nr:valine--tRNA ligase [Oscillospiraceae bacterium]